MTDKEFHKLKRTELLRLLLEERKENERLRDRINELEEQVQKTTLDLENAGSIAEASLRLSGVFEAAQHAADLYLNSIRQKYPEAQDEQQH